MVKYVEKVWGSEEWIVNSDLYCGKILNVERGYRCSYHHHKLKDETFYVLKGRLFFKKDDEVFIAEKGDVVHIPVGCRHSFGGVVDSRIIEISTKHYDSDSYRDDDSGEIEEGYFEI